MPHQLKGLRYTAEAPSNIAFIKYWGKSDALRQWPANNSLSMTLEGAKTITSVWPSQQKGPDQIFYEDQPVSPNTPFAKRVLNHTAQMKQHFDRPDLALSIATRNTFPKGCGIASSASGFAALTLAVAGCLTESSSIDEMAAKNAATRSDLADWARRGSGSACRSLWGGFVLWNRGPSADSQSYEQVFDASHWGLRDSIILLETGEKAVSSTEAHQFAKSSPLFEMRLAGLAEKQKLMMAALAARDLHQLGPLLEQEALEMHCIALTGTPAVAYLTEATRDFICWLRQERWEGRLAAYATIDAGANVHLIHEDKNHEAVQQRLALYPGRTLTVLEDGVGKGPKLSFEEC